VFGLVRQNLAGPALEFCGSMRLQTMPSRSFAAPGSFVAAPLHRDPRTWGNNGRAVGDLHMGVGVCASRCRSGRRILHKVVWDVHVDSHPRVPSLTPDQTSTATKWVSPTTRSARSATTSSTAASSRLRTPTRRDRPMLSLVRSSREAPTTAACVDLPRTLLPNEY
jgi:hypothetical protein